MDSQKSDLNSKSVLGRPDLLANILKGCTEEFKDKKISEIIPCIHDLSVQELPLEPGHTNMPRIHGMANEDAVRGEGTIYFDIFFTVQPPDASSFFYVNVEPQGKQNPGYSLIKRGIFYAARMISSQYGRVFDHGQYGKLKKVYSIWICLSPKKEFRGHMARYRMQEITDCDQVKLPQEEYNLMEVILLYLDHVPQQTQTRLIQALSIYFSGKMEAAQRIQQLEQFDIHMTRNEVEEVNEYEIGYYDRAFQDGEEKGREEGLKEGREEGRKEGRKENMIECIKSVMQKAKLSAVQAMELLGIPVDEQEQYLKLLG